MTTPWLVAFTLLWAFVILVAFVLVGALRRVTNVLEKAETQLAAEGSGVGVMTVVPEFELYRRDGTTISSAELVVEPTIVLFMESSCRPCKQLAVDLDGFDDKVDEVPFVVVLDDTQPAREFPISPGVRVLYERGHAVSDLFQSVVTPQAFVLDVGGVVLDRKRPRDYSALRQMAWWQREGGAPKTSVSASNGSSRATSHV
jgi:hypothetical protein